MFTLRDRRTGELFDRWSDLGDKRRCLLERSWAGVFRNHLLVELPVDDLCRHLDERMGRPSKDLHVVIGVLLLHPNVLPRAQNPISTQIVCVRGRGVCAWAGCCRIRCESRRGRGSVRRGVCRRNAGWLTPTGNGQRCGGRIINLYRKRRKSIPLNNGNKSRVNRSHLIRQSNLVITSIKLFIHEMSLSNFYIGEPIVRWEF